MAYKIIYEQDDVGETHGLFRHESAATRKVRQLQFANSPPLKSKSGTKNHKVLAS